MSARSAWVSEILIAFTCLALASIAVCEEESTVNAKNPWQLDVTFGNDSNPFREGETESNYDFGWIRGAYLPRKAELFGIDQALGTGEFSISHLREDHDRTFTEFRATGAIDIHPSDGSESCRYAAMLGANAFIDAETRTFLQIYTAAVGVAWAPDSYFPPHASNKEWRLLARHDEIRDSSTTEPELDISGSTTTVTAAWFSTRELYTGGSRRKHIRPDAVTSSLFEVPQGRGAATAFVALDAARSSTNGSEFDGHSVSMRANLYWSIRNLDQERFWIDAVGARIRLAHEDFENRTAFSGSRRSDDQSLQAGLFVDWNLFSSPSWHKPRLRTGYLIDVARSDAIEYDYTRRVWTVGIIFRPACCGDLDWDSGPGGGASTIGENSGGAPSRPRLPSMPGG